MTTKYSGFCVFNPADAVRFGIDEAILLYVFRFFDGQEQSARAPGDPEGVTFLPAAVSTFFPYWTFERFREILWSLADQGALEYVDRSPESFLLRSPARQLSAEESPAQDGQAFSFSKRVKGPTPGYIYLLRSEDGHYKIGKSRTPEAGIRSVGLILPFEIEALHVTYSHDHDRAERDHDRAERDLHERFTDVRVRGEWFRLSDADVAGVQSLTEI